MSRSFPELYRPYNDRLIAELGLDWYEVQETYKRLGNTPGIYPDVALLLVEMVRKADVQYIVEIGSGVSTLYLASACMKFNKSFRSFEEDDGWISVTRELLSEFGMPWLNPFMFSIERYDVGLVRYTLGGGTAALFLDSQQTLRENFLSDPSVTVGSTSFILIDDCESPHHVVPNVAALASVGRTNIFMYNPVGRKDRTVLVNPKDNAFNVAEWVWGWRPDQVYW